MTTKETNDPTPLEKLLQRMPLMHIDDDADLSPESVADFHRVLDGDVEKFVNAR
ncbi:MAG: hypothetical protein WC457_01210 [Patescibacteria group bacterium]